MAGKKPNPQPKKFPANRALNQKVLKTQRRNYPWRYAVAAGALLTILAAGPPAGCNDAPEPPGRPESNPSTSRGDPVNAAASSPKTGDFVLLFTGNWKGQLEPCGCSENQLGGVDRRSDLIRTVPSRRRLLLDSGPLVEKSSRQGQLKLETFLYSLGQLDYDAIALTGRELDLVLDKLALDPNSRPPIVATNMADAVRQKFQILPFLEKNLLIDNRKLDCLVLALADPQAVSSRRTSNLLQLQDPVAALKQTLTALNIAPKKPSPDKLIIVMLTDANEKLTRELTRIPALDILLTVGSTDEPEVVSKTDSTPLLVTTGELGKYLGRFDLFASAASDLPSASFSSVPVKDSFRPDPAIVSYIDDYQLLLEIEDLIRNENQMPRLEVPDGSQFVGSESCANGCHDDIVTKWKTLKHAHAMDTLVHAKRQYDPECVVCHSVAMEYNGGYQSIEQTPQFAAVGCENCHGPAQQHIESGLELKQIFTPCEDCHTTLRSPNFARQREQYFQKIKHWNEPRSFWP